MMRNVDTDEAVAELVTEAFHAHGGQGDPEPIVLRDRREGMGNHKCEEFRWTICVNEVGWVCIQCGEKSTQFDPPGYNPVLDEAQIDMKVGDILMEMSEADFASVSNGSEGEFITTLVANRCRKTGRYAQDDIVRFIAEYNAQGDYWKDLSDSIRKGKDPRDRCECGALATTWVSLSTGQSGNFCNEHYRTAGGQS